MFLILIVSIRRLILAVAMGAAITISILPLIWRIVIISSVVLHRLHLVGVGRRTRRALLGIIFGGLAAHVCQLGTRKQGSSGTPIR